MPSELRHDEKEDDPKYMKQIEAAGKEAEKRCKKFHGKMGYCHRYWAEKQRILKEKYKIDWKHPAELNPYCKFD
jgi:hypothetical protein